MKERVQRYKKNCAIRAEDSSTSADTSISRQVQFGRKKMKRDRSKLYRDNKRLIKEQAAAIKKAEKYKKRYHRLVNKRHNSLCSIPIDKISPMSLTERTVKECLGKLTPRKKKIVRQLFINNNISIAMKNKYVSSSKIEKKSLKRAIAPLLVKYRLAHLTLASFSGIKGGIRKHIPVAKKLSSTKKRSRIIFY